MDYDKAMAWCAALRSGEFEQAQQALTKIEEGKEKHCCLGVECRLAVADGLNLDITQRTHYSGLSMKPVETRIQYDGSESLLPMSVVLWGNFRNKSPRFYIDRNDDAAFAVGHSDAWGTRFYTSFSLSDLNDDDFTFPQIADVIERFYDQL